MMDLEFDVSQKGEEHQIAAAAKFSCTLMYMWEANLVAVTHVLVAEAFSDGISVLMLLLGTYQVNIALTCFSNKKLEVSVLVSSCMRNSCF